MNGEINSRSPDEIKKFQKETDLIRFKKIFHKLTRRLWKEQLAGNWKELADWHPAEKKTTPLSSLFKKRTRRFIKYVDFASILQRRLQKGLKKGENSRRNI